MHGNGEPGEVADGWPAEALSGVRLGEHGLAFSSRAIFQLFEHIPVAVAVTIGPAHRFLYANNRYRQAIHDDSDPVDRNLAEVFRVSLQPEIPIIRDRVLSEGHVLRAAEVPIMPGPDGPGFYWDITYLPLLDEAGEAAAGILTFAVDVTDKVRARGLAESRASEETARANVASHDRERLALAAEATGLGIWEWHVETGGTHWSDEQKVMWGLRPDEHASYDYWESVLHPEDRGRVIGSIQALLDPDSGGRLQLEHRIVLPGGETRWISSRGRMLYDLDTGRPLRLIGTVLDITHRKKEQADLQEALASKEILLREVNHRIKNSLQLVSSMLALQSGQLPDPAFQRLVREAQARIQVVASVHERLYRSQDLSFVDLDIFLETLCRDVERAGLQDSDEIAVSLSVQPMKIGNDRAVPVALVLNELLTNAIKYAYPQRKGIIEVSLRAGEGSAILTIADNGVGLPGDFVERQAASLGFRIINGLIRQLHGELRVIPCETGTTFEIVVPTMLVPSES